MTIIGAGAFGVALGKILTDNGHGIVYFDTKNSMSLEVATVDADVLVIAIPAAGVAEFAQSLPVELRGLPVILTSKGLFDLDVFADYARFSMLGGASFATDIMEGRTVTFTATDELAKMLFENERVVVELTDDNLGVALCGSLRTIYVIGAGALMGAKNELLVYLQQALAEMKLYLVDHGAKPETADLACGVGDLTMTATDEESRNLRFGNALRAGQAMEEARDELGTVEGLDALKLVKREGYPMISEIYDLVYGDEAE